MALSILSGISVGGLIDAVKTENYALLVAIPGIGKSKAEKLVFELKRKIKKLEEFIATAESIDFTSRDAVEALISLGFNEIQSSKIVSQIIKDNPEFSVENIIKEALKFVGS